MHGMVALKNEIEEMRQDLQLKLDEVQDIAEKFVNKD